ncbi:MAG: TetR/AcrR family transcriptional regulator [Polyangiales bacterium]
MDIERTAASTTDLTRVPQQARSREKFEAILAAALRLIHEKGYEQVSVREIAREVNLPIASVYQYFPNKLSIVRQLWEGYTSELGRLLGAELEALAKAPSQQSMKEAVGNVVDHMVAHHQNNPAFLDIWRSVDGSPELRALNRQDTLRVAEAISAAAQLVHPESDPQLIMNRALIACEAGSGTVKLAQELPAERLNGLYDDLKSVLIAILAEAE